MTLDVLDELTLARLGRVEVWVSLYWDEPYNTEGSFTLEVRPAEENLSLLREGRWLRRSDSDVPMRICHRSNENQDSNLVVTGFPGTWIFTKRAGTSIVKNENAEQAMRRLVSAMQPWPKLELGELVGFDTTYTAQTSGGYLEWTANKITVTAYMYAHAWDNGSSMEQEVRLVMNIPLTYQKDTDPQLRPDNYYQIPVCNGKALNRNTCYRVTATVNAPGAENPSTPVQLTDLKYTVENWIDETVNVGGGDRPTFLVLNRYDLEMHNKEDDRTSLIFTSSSEVTAQITRVYYIDKFGREQNLEKRYPDNPNDNEWGVSTGYRWRSHGNILITPDKGLNGKLDVHSDLPRNNTIRYIEVRVTNEDGNERTVTIEQYPLEYITNIQGWYSYRDDFKNSDPNPTTYEYVGDKITGIALATRNISSWNGEYRYLTGTDGLFGGPPDGFFVSKVAKLRNDGSGQSDLYEYYYTSNSNRLRESRYSEINGRMYTIVLTGTSSEYTLGRPRMVQDTYHPELMVTDPGQDNAQLVSPSFMIGSCVGEFQVGGGNLKLDGSDNSVRVAREHCAHYVETYKDPKTDRTVTLDDWRLPTEAELKIIFKFQGSKDQDADAIDYRLNGQYYYSASGRFYNEKYTVSGTGVACVRDAYGKKE